MSDIKPLSRFNVVPAVLRYSFIHIEIKDERLIAHMRHMTNIAEPYKHVLDYESLVAFADARSEDDQRMLRAYVLSDSATCRHIVIDGKLVWIIYIPELANFSLVTEEKMVYFREAHAIVTREEFKRARMWVPLQDNTYADLMADYRDNRSIDEFLLQWNDCGLDVKYVNAEGELSIRTYSNILELSLDTPSTINGRDLLALKRGKKTTLYKSTLRLFYGISGEPYMGIWSFIDDKGPRTFKIPTKHFKKYMDQLITDGRTRVWRYSTDIKGKLTRLEYIDAK